jgi:hypothetical protein
MLGGGEEDLSAGVFLAVPGEALPRGYGCVGDVISEIVVIAVPPA